MLLHKKADIVQNLLAHLDIAELGCMGELQFFAKPVQNSGIEVGSLVEQQQQFRGGGRVLIIGLQTTRCFYGDGQGQAAKIIDLRLGCTGSNVDSHIGDDLVTRKGGRKYDLKGELRPGRGIKVLVRGTTAVHDRCHRRKDAFQGAFQKTRLH